MWEKKFNSASIFWSHNLNIIIRRMVHPKLYVSIEDIIVIIWNSLISVLDKTLKCLISIIRYTTDDDIFLLGRWIK